MFAACSFYILLWFHFRPTNGEISQTFQFMGYDIGYQISNRRKMPSDPPMVDQAFFYPWFARVMTQLARSSQKTDNPVINIEQYC